MQWSPKRIKYESLYGAEIRLKIIGSFPWKIPKDQNRV